MHKGIFLVSHFHYFTHRLGAIFKIGPFASIERGPGGRKKRSFIAYFETGLFMYRTLRSD